MASNGCVLAGFVGRLDGVRRFGSPVDHQIADLRLALDPLLASS